MVKGFGPLLPGFKQVPFGDHDALRAAVLESIAETDFAKLTR